MMEPSRRPFIGLAFTLLLLAPEVWADDYTTPNTGVCWNLDSLVVHSGGVVAGSSQEFAFNGSVTISSLDTLIIDAGKTILFDPGPGDVHLAAEGFLFAHGTAAKLITFTTTEHFPPGNWGGLRIGQGILEYCLVEYAVTGITVNGVACLMNNRIIGNREGIRLNLFQGGGPVVIRDNLIHINLNGGILWDGGLDAGTPTGKQGDPLIEGNQILNNDAVGIHFAWGTRAIIRDNLISYHYVGISSGPNDESIVVENTISENVLGVLCDYDMFPGKLNLGDLGNHSPDDDGGNQIHDNIEFDVYNASAESIKAEGNHWGTSDPAAIDGHIYDNEEDVSDADGNGIISGPVDFIPTGETGVRRSTWGRIKVRFK
ncbi:NosD domain-containing protein [Candidatus Zixiibacteriota bacterium]